MEIPIAPKRDHTHNEHGLDRYDPYFWMNDREDPALLKYLEDENSYTENELSHLKGFREDLFEEMKSRIKETDMSVPYEFEGYFYFTRYEKGGEYPLYCRKQGNLDNEEEVILNVNHLAEGKAYYDVRGLSICSEKSLLAFGDDELGRRIYSLRFKDLGTGAMLEDVLENTTGSAIWSEKGDYVFYTVKDESLRPFQIMRHKIGSSQKEDVLVFEEKDETYGCSVYKSKSRRLIFISSYATESSEYRFIEANDPLGDFEIVLARENEHEYSIDHFEDHFYILTNWKAKNFRLMKGPIGASTKEQWEELIPHRNEVLLEDIELFTDFMVVEERENGLVRIKVISQRTNESYYLPFKDEAYSAWTGTNLEFNTHKLRLGYTSMTTPSCVYAFDMNERSFDLLKQQEVLGEFSEEEYESKRLFVEVRDGAKVPVSLVYKKDKLQKAAPLLLYGYGSYGHSLDPYFSSIRLSLLNRGFVFAIAHIRGGEEMGRHWYDEGKKLKKLNTFYDFIDVGDYLIQEEWTSKAHLYAMGGSAGGLLMGAVMNLRPDMWKGLVASVPFVDVVTTMLDESIPLTTGEYDEWGDPNEKEYFDYMLSYSPYDQVEAKEYPNLLVTSGLHDSQVQYWEPTKWVAKLRANKTDQNILLLHTNMDAGHSGASGRFEGLKEVALEYAFIFNLEGIKS